MLETTSFSNFSVKFLLKIDDSEVAAARTWELKPHIRSKLADAWLWRPMDTHEMGWAAADWGLR